MHLLAVDLPNRNPCLRTQKESGFSHTSIISIIAIIFTFAIILSIQIANAAPPVVTPAAPDAGALMLQMERGIQSPLPEAKPPEVHINQELKSLNGLAVNVHFFRFQGNTLVGNDTLTEYVKPWAGRDNTFEDLQNAAIAVANAYRDSGWVVRTYLPEQDVSKGVITIQVVEAVLGKIIIEKQGDVRLSDEKIRNYVLDVQPIGGHIKQSAMDRSLLIFQDLGLASVEGNLARGEADSETDLVLALKPKPLLQWLVTGDNFGSISTGLLRANATVSARSLFRMADLTTVNYIHTEGSDYFRVEESIPIGFAGWQAGIYLADFNFKNIDPTFKALAIQGDSISFGLFGTYPVIRSTERNLFVKFAGDHKMISNQSMGVDTSNYTVDVASATFVGNQYDGIMGGGVTNVSLSAFGGNVNYDGSANQPSDSSGPKVAGFYGKVLGSISRLQQVTTNNTLYVSLSAQYASKNLDSSEQFYLSGPYAVRGYSSAAGCSDGILMNIELRHAFTEYLTLAGFYDFGQGTVNKDNNFAGGAIVNNYSLSSAGLSLAVNGFYGFNGSLAWSHRIGDNPLRLASGNDPDGTLQLDKIWLSISHPF